MQFIWEWHAVEGDLGWIFCVSFVYERKTSLEIWGHGLEVTQMTRLLVPSSFHPEVLVEKVLFSWFSVATRRGRSQSVRSKVSTT